MLIAGEWQLFDDGVTRPTVRALVLSGDGNPVGEDFLIDAGAEEFVSKVMKEKNPLLTRPAPPLEILWKEAAFLDYHAFNIGRTL